MTLEPRLIDIVVYSHIDNSNELWGIAAEPVERPKSASCEQILSRHPYSHSISTLRVEGTEMDVEIFLKPPLQRTMPVVLRVGLDPKIHELR